MFCKEMKLPAMNNRITTVLLVLMVAAAFFGGCSRKLVDADDERAVLESKSEILLGTFQVTGHTLVVSDPGYDLDTVERGHGAKLHNPLKGGWRAHAVLVRFQSPASSFVADLVVCHESVDPAKLSWEKGSEILGVDAGMMGVYDLQQFYDSSIVPANMRWTLGDGKDRPIDPDNLWFSMCCELTSSGSSGAAITGGVVSSSGMGDGAYEYFLSRSSDGHVVGVKVHFVDDDGRG